MIYLLAALSFVIGLVLRKRKKSELDHKTPNTLWIISGLILSVAAGILIRFNDLNPDYLFHESRQGDSLSVFHSPAMLAAYPIAWARIQAGPVLAVASLVSVLVLARKRQLAAAMPILIWLFLPMILMGFLAKRNDYYILAAGPAAYVLVAVGIACLKSRTLKAVSIVVIISFMAVFWGMCAARSRDDGLAINPFSALQDSAMQYLVFPRSSPCLYENVAEWIIQQCGPWNGRIYLLRLHTDDRILEYFLWRKMPGLITADVLQGPDLAGHMPCVVFRNPDDNIDIWPPTLTEAIQVFSDYVKDEPNYTTEDIVLRQNNLSGIADIYHVLPQRNRWGVYVPFTGDGLGCVAVE